MEPQKAPPSRRRLTGAYVFTISALGGAIAETVFSDDFGQTNPTAESLTYGVLFGGIALPWMIRSPPPYTMAERGTYAMAGAVGMIIGRGLVQMMRQYL